MPAYGGFLRPCLALAHRTRATKAILRRALNPLLPAEERELYHRRHDDQCPGEEIAELPVELGEVVLEVLAVEADDEGGQQQQRRDHRERLHDLVLVVRDLRLEVVANARDQVARELETVECAQELVQRGVERDLDVMRKDLFAVRHLDDVVDDAADRVARRGERAPDVKQVVAQLRDACAVLLRPRGFDLDEEIDELEDVVETSRPQQIRARISQLRHDLLHIRRTLAPTRDAVRRVVDNVVEVTDGEEVFPHDVEIAFNSALDKLLRAFDGLELSRDLIASVRDYLQ